MIMPYWDCALGEHPLSGLLDLGRQRFPVGAVFDFSGTFFCSACVAKDDG